MKKIPLCRITLWNDNGIFLSAYRLVAISYLFNNLFLVYFNIIFVSILVYGNYTRMLRAVLNTSWRQHSTRHQLYGHLPPPITKTIQVRRTRHAGHCWRSKDELISDVLLWTPTYGCAKAGRPARTYIQQLCEDTGCNLEDLPEAMNDRRSGERGSGISVLAARHDDDDISLYQYIMQYIHIYIFTNPSARAG